MVVSEKLIMAGVVCFCGVVILTLAMSFSKGEDNEDTDSVAADKPH